MTQAEALSIADIAIYPFILVVLILVLFRHGISRQSGYIYLATFCIIRIVGGGFGIAAAKNPKNVSDLIWSTVLGSIGIFSLIGATLGLLKRIIDQTSTREPHPLGDRDPLLTILTRTPIIGVLFRIILKRATAVSRRSRFVQLLQLPAIGALILCIIGALDQTSAKVSDQRQGKALLKAGILIFLAIYLCAIGLAAKSATEFKRTPAGEKRILVVIIAAMPLMAVRLAWTLLAYFSSFHTFSIYDGSIVARVLMATLEEYLIVIAFTVIGLVTPRYSSMVADGDYTERSKAQGSLRGIHFEAADWDHEPREIRR